MNFGQANQQALVTQYGYEEVGNRISQTDANQHTTKYVYDQLGRRISRVLPAGQSETYSYDAVGNLQQKIDFNGKTTTYAYDSNNRLQSKTPDPSFNAPAVGFTYSATGKRLTMSDVSGLTTYTYDPQTDRLTQKQTPEGTLNYTYDAAGNLKSLQSQNQNGASDAYTYDADNRLSTVTDASGQTTYAYDNVGNLQSFAYPNGVTTAYTYDSLNRLKQMGAGKNGTQQANYVYTLGAAGNRLTVAELSGRTVNYGYDSLYRLTSEAITNDPNNHNNTTQYQYDNVGNRQQLIVNGTTANVYSYDSDDRLGSDQYDANGNTTGSAGTTNVYDFENHLVQHGTQPGAVTIVYDGDGNRVSETVAGVTTKYLVDTQNPTGYAQVVDELQNGAVTRTYSWGLELISKLETGNSKRSFYGFDGHGSVRFLTDSNGTVTDTYDYDAFGNLINQTGSTPNNYLFAGEQYDPALGLYYNRARYLNTSTGRFWSMDIYDGDLVSPLSLHKYLYTHANPVTKTDRSGHEIDEVEEAEEEALDEDLEGAEAKVDRTAEEKVEEELESETIIHVTSGENAMNINMQGLTAKEYPEVAPTVPPGIPGAFYAIGFKSRVPFGLIADVASLVVNLFIQDRFGSASLSVMVGSLPGPLFTELTTSGAIRQQSLNVSGPVALQELVCLPESFPVIDEYNQFKWGIFPLTQ